MAAQKQRRLIDRGVDIVVATPGRLWDLLEEVRLISGPEEGINIAVELTQFVYRCEGR